MADIYAIRSLEPEPMLIRSLKDGILHLELNNPPANALSMAMMEALQAALDEAGDDRDVRVIVIGARGKLFSGGHDLKEMQGHRADPDRGKGFFDTTMQTCARLMQSVVRHPQARDRRRRRHRHGCRLPTRRLLRSGDRFRKGPLRRQRHRCWPVLLDAGRGPVAQGRTQAGDGDVAHRRDSSTRRRRRTSASSTASCRRNISTRP